MWTQDPDDIIDEFRFTYTYSVINCLGLEGSGYVLEIFQNVSMVGILTFEYTLMDLLPNSEYEVTIFGENIIIGIPRGTTVTARTDVTSE